MKHSFLHTKLKSNKVRMFLAALSKVLWCLLLKFFLNIWSCPMSCSFYQLYWCWLRCTFCVLIQGWRIWALDVPSCQSLVLLSNSCVFGWFDNKIKILRSWKNESTSTTSINPYSKLHNLILCLSVVCMKQLHLVSLLAGITLLISSIGIGDIWHYGICLMPL